MSAAVTTSRALVLVVGLLWAGSAFAAGKVSKLPADFAFPQGDGSPGKVTFSHGSHIDEAKPSCVACHPNQFRILEAGKTRMGDPIKHQQMEAGAGCGSCHGKTAFALDACETCHRS